MKLLCIFSTVVFLSFLLSSSIHAQEEEELDELNMREKIEDLEAELSAIKELIRKNAEENTKLKEAAEELKRENAELKDLIRQNAAASETLQQENAKIKEMFQQNSDETSRQQRLSEELKQESENIIKQVLDFTTEWTTKPPVRSKVPVQLYGYVKADLAYNSARTNDVNLVRWVESEAILKDDDDEFGITARESRIGLDLDVPEFNGIKTTGKFEMDFYRGDEENYNFFALRQAYLEVEFVEADFSIRAGQAWDVIFPLHGGTVNFGNLWSCGNMGYRRPQIRLTKNFELGNKSKLVFTGAATRTIGDLRRIAGVPDIDTGEDSGYPSFQGCISLFTQLFTEKTMHLFVCGHWGQEEYDINAGGDEENFASWSVGVGLQLPLTEYIEIVCELSAGKNLDAYFGGINQGVNITKIKEISSLGGWVRLTLGPFGPWQFNIAAGMDDPQDSDLNVGQRERNYGILANVYYNMGLIEGLLVACEGSYWNTQYRKQEDGDAFRIQLAFIYNF